jgi:hypothetical protein
VRTLLTGLITLLVAASNSHPVKAQADQPSHLIEPDTSEVFYRLDSGKLISLERQTAVIHSKTSGFIVMSMKTVTEFRGGKSPVRFPSGEPMDFVVRSVLGASGVDQNTFYCLRHLDEKKKTRELLTMVGHASPMGASAQMNVDQGVLPVEFGKYGSGSIKLHTEPLPSGEYAVSRIYGQTVFCFGVD